MTWSPFFTEVTHLPTSTTTPAPSWPRIAGKMPSGSAPDKVNSSVWQMPVALISTRTSPSRGPSRSTSMISSGFPAATATAARVFIRQVLQGMEWCQNLFRRVFRPRQWLSEIPAFCHSRATIYIISSRMVANLLLATIFEVLTFLVHAAGLIGLTHVIAYLLAHPLI